MQLMCGPIIVVISACLVHKCNNKVACVHSSTFQLVKNSLTKRSTLNRFGPPFSTTIGGSALRMESTTLRSPTSSAPTATRRSITTTIFRLDGLRALKLRTSPMSTRRSRSSIRCRLLASSSSSTRACVYSPINLRAWPFSTDTARPAGQRNLGIRPGIGGEFALHTPSLRMSLFFSISEYLDCVNSPLKARMGLARFSVDCTLPRYLP